MLALQRLWLSLNEITMLPPELCYLTNLYDLRLDGVCVCVCVCACVLPHDLYDLRLEGSPPPCVHLSS
jgi:hypothetical protein